jgi:hypothetical protein
VSVVEQNAAFSAWFDKTYRVAIHGHTAHADLMWRAWQAAQEVVWHNPTEPPGGAVPYRDVLLEYIYLSDQTKRFVVVHWAHSDGDGEQPAFGPGWFIRNGPGFHEVPRTWSLIRWTELPNG